MQDLAREQAAVGDCEARLAALPYDAAAASALEATVEAESAAVRSAGERVDVLSSQLGGEHRERGDSCAGVLESDRVPCGA